MASSHTPEGSHPTEGEGGSTKPASPFFFHHDARQREGRAYDLQQPPRTIYPLVKTAHLDFGVEEVAVGSEIPWHHHDDKEEVIFVWRGHGRAYINAGPGTKLDFR
jgi:quercetin dioxygenase-like cupin family protein